MPNFGRLVAHDENDKNYLLRSLIEQIPLKAAPGVRYYPPGPVLDQEDTSCCVGFASRARLNAAPIMVKPTIGPNGYDIYRIAVTLDEFPENDHEAKFQDTKHLQFGTSVRAGMKALQQLGYISNYVWATSVDEIVQFLLMGFGTVIMGTTWKSNMLEPDNHDMIHARGQDVGGHCYELTGVNTTREVVRVQNSWGPTWADHGRAWLSIKDLETLLAEDGEAVVPTEIKIQATK